MLETIHTGGFGIGSVQISICNMPTRHQIVSGAPRRTDGTPDERLQPDIHGLQIVPDIENLRFGFLPRARVIGGVAVFGFWLRAVRVNLRG